MRVLQVLHNYPPEFNGGVERSVVEAVAGLQRLGHEVAVLAGSEWAESAPRIVEEAWEGAVVYRLRRGPGHRTPVDPFDPGLVALYEQVLDRVRPEVVHVHHWWNLGTDVVRRAARRGLGTVLTLHDFFSTCSLFFRMPDGGTPCDRAQTADACGPCVGERFGLDLPEVRWLVTLRGNEFRAEVHAAGEVLVPSRSHGERLARFLGAGRPLRPVPLGSPSRAAVDREERASPTGPLRVLHFGNISRLKGVELLCRAVNLADPDHRHIRLTLAGEVVEAGLDLGGAELTGPYDEKQLPALAAASDVAVFPSLAMETYGLVVDEAVRLGLPVVVSDRGALGDRLGGRGVVVPVTGPEALADVLRGFIADPARLAALRRAPMPSLPTPDDHCRTLAEIYAAVRGGPRPEVDVETPLLVRAMRSRQRIQEVVDLIARLSSESPSAEDVPVNATPGRLTDATTARRPRPAAVVRDETGNLVSVITRTRNRPGLLREAVASVAAQTWPHVELVVVNDGGEDVAAVLDPFRDRLPITYVTPGRVGRCRAGNLGLEAARGTWIAWLDDDDLHFPHHLATMVGRLAPSGHKIGYSDAYRIDLEPAGPGEEWREVGRTVPYSEDFSRIMLFRRAYIHLVTVVLHHECWERIGGFDEGLEVLEDWDLFFRLAQDYDFLHVPEVTAAFRIRSDQSNAVTALRQEFVETRSRLFARYIHLAFPELLGMIDHGQQLLGDLVARVARLEAGSGTGPATGPVRSTS